MQIFGTITLLISACFTWWLTLWLLPMIGANETFVFLAPILLMIAPVAIRAFKTKSATFGAFLLAIAPILGVLNFLPWAIAIGIGELLLGNSGDRAIIFARVFAVLPWIFVGFSILLPTKKANMHDEAAP